MHDEPTKSSPSNEGFSMLSFMKNNTRMQMHAYQTYLCLRYVLSIGHLMSSFLKLPTYYEMIKLVLQVYDAKKNRPKDEPPSEQPPPSLELLLNVAFLYLAFAILIIYQFCISIKIFRKRFQCLLAFVLLFTFYLLFIFTAYFADWQNSTMPLGLALFMTKYSLFGFWVVEAPDFWYYSVLKFSILLDVFLLPPFILFYVLITKYKVYTVDGKALMERVYNLVNNV